MIRGIGIGLLSAGLVACGSAPKRALDGAAIVATEHYQAGRYAEAAKSFRAMARDAGVEWLVRAADAALQAGDIGACDETLLSVDPESLYRERELYRLLRVLCATQSPPVHVILATLDFPATRLPAHYRSSLHRTLAGAFLEAGQPFSSALERIHLDQLLLDAELRRQNQEQLLRDLQQLPLSRLEELRDRHAPDDPVYAWLALVLEVKTHIFGGGSVAAAVAAWRVRFPEHAAAAMDLGNLLVSDDLNFAPPKQVALLLPLNGPLQRYAHAVRDGFLAAYYADTQRSTEIRIYDVGAALDDVRTRYREALADGADRVVGPLDRDAVTSLLLEADASVPILALNYQEGIATPAAGHYQFGLMPEDEAVGVAERMLRSGARRAVVLTPSTGLGERIRRAFIERYEQLGGHVLSDLTYPEEAVDYGAVIRQAVGVTTGQSRQRQLQRLLGVTLHFEAQRRHDLDAIFLAVRPSQGRRIKPQLAFYNAGDVPVFTTSHVYSGWPGPEDNRDLDGVTFCDAPWVLDSQSFSPDVASVQSLFPDTRGPAARFFALGLDAYRVLPYLGWLDRYKGDTFPGATGQLRMDERGRIRRQLDCAVFHQGMVRYEPAPDWREDAP